MRATAAAIHHLSGQSGDFAGTRGKVETRHSNRPAELRHQLAAISDERNEPRPLGFAGPADSHDAVSHREGLGPYGVNVGGR